jgi:hypothetical protein
MEPPQTLDCPTCSVVAEAPHLAAIATTASAVFWVDHGSFDRLGNHQEDGRLLQRSLVGVDVQVVANNLQGPIDLTLSDNYAYITLDESTAPGGKGGLARIPIAGGQALLLQSIRDPGDVPPIPGHLVSGGGEVFWLEGNTIHHAAETAQTTLAPLRDALGVLEIFGDESLMYLYGGDEVQTLSFAGGEPTLLQVLEAPDSGSFYRGFQVSEAYIYAVEDGGSTSGPYLTRMPKAGGIMKRMAKLGHTFWHLMVEGDRWIWDPPTFDYSQRRIAQESIATPSSGQVLVTASPGAGGSVYWGPMAMSSVGLFFENADTLYLVPYAN